MFTLIFHGLDSRLLFSHYTMLYHLPPGKAVGSDIVLTEPLFNQALVKCQCTPFCMNKQVVYVTTY